MNWALRSVGAGFFAVALAACSLVADGDDADAARSTWVDAWEAAPAGAVPDICGGVQPVGALPNGIARSQTLRMVLRPSVEGDAIKVRLTNRYGEGPLRINHVTIARQATGMTLAGRVHDVLFSRSRAAVIPAGEDLESDAVEMDVDPTLPITVSIAVAGGGPLTWHWTTTEARVTQVAGDQAAAVSGRAYTSPLHGYVALTGISVQTKDPTPAIAVLGDSLTEDTSLAPDNTWLEVLGERLARVDRPHALVNAGIGCAALLRDVKGAGLRGIDRLNDDVLRRDNVKYVIVFLGANDYPSGATAEQMISALQAVATRAHARRMKVFAATVFPRNSAPASQHAARNAVNEWIRTNDVFDGAIDFDSAIRSASNPNQIDTRYNSDGVHVNTRGHHVMGNAVPLRLFSD